MNKLGKCFCNSNSSKLKVTLNVCTSCFLRSQLEADYCMLLALPSGRDHIDLINQTKVLTTGFIEYLSQKLAAGIVNVAAPGSEQVNLSASSIQAGHRLLDGEHNNHGCSVMRCRVQNNDNLF